MNELIHNVTSDGDVFIPFIIFTSVGIVAFFAIFFGSIKRVAIHKETEKSRRDIAAYIAEGSMSPEDGVKLMNAASPEKNNDQA
ncbi:MAG: hypothetical protein P1U42_05265 [Phycisphaerales bacterium]|nr:hypothetical protein [Phycisphaerales bacterium]